MKAAKVVDPARAPDTARVFFGATVKIADEDDNHRTLTLVGDDEADAGAGRIGWNAPVARALRGAAVGDVRRVVLPAGERDSEVMATTYPASYGTPLADDTKSGHNAVLDEAAQDRQSGG